MRSRKAACDRSDVLDGLADRQCASCEYAAKRFAIEQFHRREAEIALASEFVERDDIGVREGGDGLRFTLEAPERGRVACEAPPAEP